MSDRNLAALRLDLQRRRRIILETTERTSAELEALRAAERDPEFEEGAQSEHEQYTLSRLTDGQRREVGAIDAAIARIDAGDYGVCRECEREIDPRRLAALPYALLCTECAQRAEQERSRMAQEPPSLWKRGLRPAPPS
ncbi:MAG: TraR/DksA C4-type zinc finger protein [Anaeromyxobacter sp.]